MTEERGGKRRKQANPRRNRGERTEGSERGVGGEKSSNKSGTPRCSAQELITRGTFPRERSGHRYNVFSLCNFTDVLFFFCIRDPAVLISEDEEAGWQLGSYSRSEEGKEMRRKHPSASCTRSGKSRDPCLFYYLYPKTNFPKLFWKVWKIHIVENVLRQSMVFLFWFYIQEGIFVKLKRFLRKTFL